MRWIPTNSTPVVRTVSDNRPVDSRRSKDRLELSGAVALEAALKKEVRLATARGVSGREQVAYDLVA